MNLSRIRNLFITCAVLGAVAASAGLAHAAPYFP